MNWPLLIIGVFVIWGLYPSARDQFRNARTVLDMVERDWMPAEHPERDPVDLSERDRTVLMHLDISTPWEDA